MGPSHTVSEINGDFSRKSQNFPTPCFCAPAEGVPLDLCTVEWMSEAASDLAKSSVSILLMWHIAHRWSEQAYKRWIHDVWKSDGCQGLLWELQSSHRGASYLYGAVRAMYVYVKITKYTPIAMDNSIASIFFNFCSSIPQLYVDTVQALW